MSLTTTDLLRKFYDEWTHFEEGQDAVFATQLVFFLKRNGLALVHAYDPARSMLHPLPHDSLQAIGDAHERASAKHGFYETWMAVYNECVRQGQNTNNDKTDAAWAAALRAKLAGKP